MIANPKLQAFVSWDKCEMGLLYLGEVVNLAATVGPLCGSCDDKLTTCLPVSGLSPAGLSAGLAYPPRGGAGKGRGRALLTCPLAGRIHDDSQPSPQGSKI